MYLPCQDPGLSGTSPLVTQANPHASNSLYPIDDELVHCDSRSRPKSFSKSSHSRGGVIRVLSSEISSKFTSRFTGPRILDFTHGLGVEFGLISPRVHFRIPLVSRRLWKRRTNPHSEPVTGFRVAAIILLARKNSLHEAPRNFPATEYSPLTESRFTSTEMEATESSRWSCIFESGQIFITQIFITVDEL